MQALTRSILAALLALAAAAAADPPAGPGAAPKHWSYRPLADAAPPAVSDAAWPRDDIDRFILQALEQKSLRPVADATKLTLVRRVYFDLLGLPPTPAQVDQFLNDDSAGALARLVDRLLASPHFGERWGRHWLDVARYADSTGGGRSQVLEDAWRYRDYVIASFNADKPFNRFAAEQIAGDLLDPGSPELIVATGFLALGPPLARPRSLRRLRWLRVRHRSAKRLALPRLRRQCV